MLGSKSLQREVVAYIPFNLRHWHRTLPVPHLSPEFPSRVRVEGFVSKTPTSERGNALTMTESFYEEFVFPTTQPPPPLSSCQYAPYPAKCRPKILPYRSDRHKPSDLEPAYIVDEVHELGKRFYRCSRRRVSQSRLNLKQMARFSFSVLSFTDRSR